MGKALLIFGGFAAGTRKVAAETTDGREFGRVDVHVQAVPAAPRRLVAAYH